MNWAKVDWFGGIMLSDTHLHSTGVTCWDTAELFESDTIEFTPRYRPSVRVQRSETMAGERKGRRVRTVRSRLLVENSPESQ